ncbi:Uncharacterised protein [uncultured Clostridium sp.]|uniref:hypothetical protein n=1 Tax=uncultured Clostridium sp. TaxID=59620 RepID=UPI000822F374|nr:hypothetical protein [uncultured Clostridium sp.]SCJ99894.1 Uncharacterised protein [uncultured Clostridium sp.]
MDNVLNIEKCKICGAYKLVTFSGIGQVGTLGENVSEEEVLKRFNFTDTSRLDLNKTYINYRNTETNEFKVIFGKGNPECINAILIKNRHGNRGTCALKWDGRYSRVTNF